MSVTAYSNTSLTVTVPLMVEVTNSIEDNESYKERKRLFLSQRKVGHMGARRYLTC